MAAYVVFIREEITNQTELDAYAIEAPAAAEGHRVSFLPLYGKHEVLVASAAVLIPVIMPANCSCNGPTRFPQRCRAPRPPLPSRPDRSARTRPADGLRSEQTGDTKFWLAVSNELKPRGLHDESSHRPGSLLCFGVASAFVSTTRRRHSDVMNRLFR